jgi:hypothetical protein
VIFNVNLYGDCLFIFIFGNGCGPVSAKEVVKEAARKRDLNDRLLGGN